MKLKLGLAAAAITLAFVPPVARADSVAGIEGARAKERQGRWLDRQDREQLRRWGSNDDWRYGRYAPYDNGYYDRPRYRYYRADPY
ncbi:exported protein of unknown function [Hyphomicrobium sp. 1Nfss2.1]|uniref:hypothetical protein n=1 Tax=Hyphomicrobium sp. 1Nfss2.1 TaxID=3413936 RepID=UPI003C7DD8E2